VLEGVAFGLRDGLDLMVEAGVPRPESVRVSGGGSRSQLWLQIIADVLETRIDRVATEEGAAFGAGILALVGVGEFSTGVDATEALVRVEPSARPSEVSGSYRDLHTSFRALYPALRSTFHALSRQVS